MFVARTLVLKFRYTQVKLCLLALCFMQDVCLGINFIRSE